MTTSLSNRQIGAVFQRLADLLEIRGESAFKVIAYRRASESIGQLTESLESVRARGELHEIPGVGKAIAQKLDDLLDTGSFKLLDEVQAQYPPGVADLLRVPDIGPKRARILYEQAGIDGLEALRDAAEAGRLRDVAGVGPKGAERIAEGLAALRAPDERIPLGVARSLGLELVHLLRDRCVGVERLELVGGVRRFEESVTEVRLVAAAARPDDLLDAFSSLPSVARIESRGPRECRVRLHDDRVASLYSCTPPGYGSLLQHHTGSDAHNGRLRQLAEQSGSRLTPQGYERDGALHPCATEQEVYNFLGMQLVPPPMREDTGEIELALEGQLQPLFDVGELRGDLHTHSEWSDGTRTIREMALAALARGYEYLCVTDHSQSLGVANGLSPERLAQQRTEIKQVNAELAPFRVLQGVELEVRGDGSMDLPDDALGELDIVVASVHSGLRQGRERVTSRALAAIRHPLVDVLAHPTGRIVGGRPGGDFDMDALYAEAQRTGTALEINSDPARLDLRDTHARAAAAAGCTLSIDSDAHSAEGLANVYYGAGVATRAWLRPEQVLNTRNLDALLSSLKRNPQA